MFIKGKNINLRKLTKADAPSLYENARDKEISKYTFIPHPYRLEDARRFIRLTQRQWHKDKGYNLGIELKSTGRVIGMIGLAKVDWKNKSAELGYWLGKRYWGKGYAAEAVKLMLWFGFGKLKLVRIWVRVFHHNHASARLLEKCGFTREGYLRKTYKKGKCWLDEYRYAILREEFKR
jgi:RimJ/RimL family protein N-acetyltransferase